jgi:hypothetical protein
MKKQGAGGLAELVAGDALMIFADSTFLRQFWFCFVNFMFRLICFTLFLFVSPLNGIEIDTI